jgi:hypothetical protein
MKRNVNNILSLVAVLATTLALTACTDVKEELGVGRNSPDEFTVVKRAPLTLPPDYTLRPPGDSTAAPSSADAAVQARTALLGKETAPAAEGAPERAMLDRLGAGSANPDIRKQIDEDNGYIALKNRSVAEKLVFWDNNGPSEKDIPDSVVDPQKEADRIKKNKAEGKPVNDGAVPVIEKKQGTLDKIF